MRYTAAMTAQPPPEPSAPPDQAADQAAPPAARAATGEDPAAADPATNRRAPAVDGDGDGDGDGEPRADGDPAATASAEAGAGPAELEDQAAAADPASATAPAGEGREGREALPLPQAAHYAGRAPATLRRALRRGQLPRTYRPGRFGPSPQQTQRGAPFRRGTGRLCAMT